MSAGALLLGFFNVALYCAVVILVALVIVWVLGLAGYPPSPDVMKWGKIVVLLLCLIVVVGWLLSLLGVGGYAPPRFLGRW